MLTFTDSMTLAGSHDLFMVHADVDRAAAESLFDLLAPEVRMWLETRCLLPSDKRPAEISRAQRTALATVILVSKNAKPAYYLRDEIHTAIALHRRFPSERRAVAVFIDGRPADRMQVPYGLRELHRFDALAEGGLPGVAQRLKKLVTTLRARGAPPALPLPSPAPPPVMPMPPALFPASSPLAPPEPIHRVGRIAVPVAPPSGVSAGRGSVAVPSRPEVRVVLAKVLRSDSDLNAFCGDYFPEVYARFTNGMDRVSKVNLFLDYADSSSIMEKLQQAYPEAVQGSVRFSARGQHSAGRPSPRYPDEITRALSMQIEQARARKQALQKIGTDTAELDREILQLRRQLREGGQLKPGDALGDGRYLLIQRLGRGGFAVVWEAYDEQRKERVAVKVLHTELAGDAIRRERFFRGARIMAELRDKAIVRVLEPHAEEGGYHYFVMELLTGGDLRSMVASGRLSRETILPDILPVAEAIARAHAKGLCHRDIKPANILLDGAGTFRLTDFDLVGGGDTTGGTKTGAIGSWIYAAPELMHRPQDADARADVYGLGMTIVFGLHGAELPMDVVRDAVGFIQGLPCSAPLKAVLKRTVEWNPDQRFANAGEVCEALRKALDHAPVTVFPRDASLPEVKLHGQYVDNGPESLEPSLDIAPLLVNGPKARHFPNIFMAGSSHAPKASSPAVGQVTEQVAVVTMLREAVTGMRLVWVPPGRFLMGSSKEPGARGFDPNAYASETPAREVEVCDGVWMAEHPVTNAQYGVFLADATHEAPKYWVNQRFNAADQPVVGVSFEDGIAFCAWLTKRLALKDGDCFNLPTEAEWEYAARGPDARRFPWGHDDPTSERACYGEPFATGAPSPIGMHPSGRSPFGCQDMVGNIYEWCLDIYEHKSRARVVRGGCWFGRPGSLRCAIRNAYQPETRDLSVGFRVVCRVVGELPDGLSFVPPIVA